MKLKCEKEYKSKQFAVEVCNCIRTARWEERVIAAGTLLLLVAG